MNRFFLSSCTIDFATGQRAIALAIIALTSTSAVHAANVVWGGPGLSAYLSGGSWTGGAVPTATDVAQFDANPTAPTININFNATTNAGTQTTGNRIEDVGAVELTSARPVGITIGNSSTTVGADGKYRLKGATVNGVNDVVLRNNSSQLLTIQNATGGGTQNMSVLLGDSTNNIVNIDGTGGIFISSIIADDVVAGAKQLTLGGAGTGSLTLNGVNTYSGGTVIRQGTIIWNVASALGTGPVTMNDANTAGATSLYKNAAGTLARNITVANAGSGTTTIGSNTGTAGTTVTYSGTVTLNRDATFKSGAGALVVFSGAIGGNGAVNVTGTGTIELDNSNSYGGGTTLTTGTLLANNASGSATGMGAVTVAAGTLGGNGAISGAVTLNGGSLSPGVAAGNIAALNTGALTFNSGSTFAYELNSSPTPSADLVNAAGAVNIALSGAALSIADLGNSVLPANTKFTLISYSGTWNGNTFDTYADDSTITVGSNQFVLNYNDTSVGSGNLNGSSFTNAVTLTLTAVPEANAFWLGGVICLVVGLTVGPRKMLGSRATV